MEGDQQQKINEYVSIKGKYLISYLKLKIAAQRMRSTSILERKRQ
jgi:hypothetical protein